MRKGEGGRGNKGEIDLISRGNKGEIGLISRGN